MGRITDDLGTRIAVGSVRRVVSLVPSLTESIAATEPSMLVGATDWCTHPGDLQVARVRGTKNPDLAAVRALEPDLVVANKEENRRVDVERLRAAGIAVWVTDIRTVDGALGSLRRLLTIALDRPCPPWLDDAERVWRANAPALRRTVAVPIWRDPWMVVGRDTFTGDLLRRLGFDNVFADSAARYPHAEIEQISARSPDLVLLPDEPYPFSATDGPEAFAGVPSAVIPGRLITWYGPSLLEATHLPAMVA